MPEGSAQKIAGNIDGTFTGSAVVFPGTFSGGATLFPGTPTGILLIFRATCSFFQALLPAAHQIVYHSSGYSTSFPCNLQGIPANFHGIPYELAFNL